MLFDAISIGRKIVNTDPDTWVVTSQDPFEAGIAGYVVAKLTGSALNVQEHGDFFSRPYWRRDSLLNTVRFAVGKLILRHANSVRVVSARIRNTMQQLHIPAERILSLPVRSDVIVQTLPETDLHEQYPDASVIILSMSRLVTQKNLPLLINAFAELCSTDPNALLLIVGQGAELPRLKRLASALKIEHRIRFLPWTDTPYALMQSADIFALSSDWEGWGRVLIEAMSAGTPVVTTNVGCAGEVLIDGSHGYVVEVRDKDMFARKLIKLAEDIAERERFGAQAQKDVQRIHISEEEYVSLWAEVLHKTINLDK
jgi:glycosyltransferase involved in cell wall biosynthesis